MARSKAQGGKATKFGYGALVSNALPTTFTNLAELTDVKKPEQTAGTIESTNYDSDSEEFTGDGSFTNGGEVPVELSYLKTQEATILGLLGVDTGFRVTKRDGSTYTFIGIMDKVGGDIPMKGRITTTFNVKISGLVAFVAGT